MKKLCTLIMLACGASSSAFAQYQLENAGFEEWDSVSYTANKTTRAGQEPTAWNSFLSGSGDLKSFAGYEQLFQSETTRPGSEGSYSALLTARSVLSVIAQGNMTTGCVNMGSITAADADGNYNYTAVDSAGFNQTFTGMPDSLRVWVKFYGTNESYPYAKVNTLLHTAGYYQDPMGNEENITATLVAKAENVEITTNNFEWQQIVIPFEYADSTDERPAYALVSFSTNATPGKGAKTDSMYVDDLEYIYNSELISLVYDSTELFQSGVSAYSLPEVVYKESNLAAQSNGHAANIGTVYNDSTGLLTITVEGDDISVNADNKHVYTIQFMVSDEADDTDAEEDTEEDTEVVPDEEEDTEEDTEVVPDEEEDTEEDTEVVPDEEEDTEEDTEVVPDEEEDTEEDTEIVPDEEEDTEEDTEIVPDEEEDTEEDTDGDTDENTDTDEGTGINSAKADETLYEIYTLNGIPVKKNATSDDLKALKEGIYIINGKKTVVK